ncbi:hypothetical protein [Leptospira ainazelensis]|uniref:hypothetical protein n=1 Tax=Leptospira ainazelensis TaxID=2810034 RepID=UPI001965A7CA|nr:hypothetical protein [Leptospira ainazelensis]
MIIGEPRWKYLSFRGSIFKIRSNFEYKQQEDLKNYFHYFFSTLVNLQCERMKIASIVLNCVKKTDLNLYFDRIGIGVCIEEIRGG